MSKQLTTTLSLCDNKNVDISEIGGDRMNADDKKSLWIVAIILVILIGILISTRGCSRQELRDDLIEPTPTPIVTPTVPEPTEPQEEEKGKIVHLSTEESTPTEEPIDLETYFTNIFSSYQVEVGDTTFELPKITGDTKVTVTTEYYFKGMYESQYTQVSGFHPYMVGTYKILYTVSSQAGSLTKEVLVSIHDTQSPTIEGMIEEYHAETETTTYQPVTSHARVNQNVTITFSDNDAIVYAEYYKAKYEWINGKDTLEQEGMQEIIEIDLQKDFVLYEDGEYHVRAYDFSGNVTEYIVTIDKENPIVSITYTRIDKNQVEVTITSHEELQELEGWTKNDDGKVLTKIYGNDIEETIYVSDLAGNQISLDIKTDHLTVQLEVQQDGQTTQSRNLNTNDGEITIQFQAQEGVTLVYSFDSGPTKSYENEPLDKVGHYTFYVMYEEKVMESIELDISNMTAED